MGWEEVKMRWPRRPIDIKCIVDVTCYYDFGHIPAILFARSLGDYLGEGISPLDVHHTYWRLQYDLFGEYAYTVQTVRKGAPFAIPVTYYGDEMF